MSDLSDRLAIEAVPSAKLVDKDINVPVNDSISRHAALEAMDTWDKFGCGPDGRLVRCDDDKHYITYVHYDDMVRCIENLPPAQPTLYGYDIQHLAFIASIMAKKGVSPEEAVTAFRDINRVIEMMLEEMKEMQEDTLKKLYAVCPAESADVMGDTDDKD